MFLKVFYYFTRVSTDLFSESNQDLNTNNGCFQTPVLKSLSALHNTNNNKEMKGEEGRGNKNNHTNAFS